MGPHGSKLDPNGAARRKLGPTCPTPGARLGPVGPTQREKLRVHMFCRWFSYDLTWVSIDFIWFSHDFVWFSYDLI